MTGSSLVALTGAELLLPTEARKGHTLLLSGDRIADIVPDQDVPETVERLHLPGMVVSPGFIDLQVNGGGGILFNDDPSPGAIRRIADAHRRYGTTALLPTLISDTPEKMLASIAAVQDARAEGQADILGLHLEGPYLTAAKRGIHDDKHFTAISSEWLDRLTKAQLGTLLMTLAPEGAAPDVIRTLTKAGIRLSAGHTMATYDQAREAIAAGVSGFTHLFNAMPPLLSRAPGPVAAALESDAWCMLIADGYHLHDAILGLVARAKSDGRIILVSDAMSSVGTDLTEFELGGRRILVEEGRCTSEDGTLAGSALTMIGAVQHMKTAARLELHEAVRMATLEPATFLGVESERGSLAPGLRADLAILDQDLSVAATVIGGDMTPLLAYLDPRNKA